jgi:hypothetical protein
MILLTMQNQDPANRFHCKDEDLLQRKLPTQFRGQGHGILQPYTLAILVPVFLQEGPYFRSESCETVP